MAVMEDVAEERRIADAKYGAFASTHEAYGVLSEEVAELLDAIRRNNPKDIRAEAVQVAAVAMRLAQAVRENQSFRERSGF